MSWLWWNVVAFHAHINTFLWSNADFVFQVGASSTRRVMNKDRSELIPSRKMIDHYFQVYSFKPDSSSDDIVLPESFMDLTI